MSTRTAATTEGGSSRILARGAAVVTGSSSGNGRAIALELARRGFPVVCADIRPEPNLAPDKLASSTNTDALIRDGGGHACFTCADVQSRDQMTAAVASAVELGGRLDVFVNNAGVSAGRVPFLDESDEQWQRTLAINVTGARNGCRAAITQMLAQDPNPSARGRIVNMGSVAGLIGSPDGAAYLSSKGAIHQLTRALAIEFAQQRIAVNAVAPGFVPTALTRDFYDDPAMVEVIRSLHPWPSPGSSEDIARAVAFLASDDANWITGVVLPVDGGLTAQ